METKICSRCNVSKYLEEFAFKSKKDNKYQPACKTCMKDAYYTGDTRIKHLEKQKAYRETESFKERRQEYINSGQNYIHNKKYYLTDKGKLGLKKYKSTDDFKKKSQKHQKKYNQTNRGKAVRIASRQKRRELKAGINLEYYSINDREYTLKLFNYICFNCGSTDNISIDHHKSLSAGFGLSKSNAVVLCRSCNSSKNNKDPKDFYSEEQLQLLEESYGIIN